MVENFELVLDVVLTGEVAQVPDNSGMADLGGVHHLDRRSGAEAGDFLVRAGAGDVVGHGQVERDADVGVDVVPGNDRAA